MRWNWLRYAGVRNAPNVELNKREGAKGDEVRSVPGAQDSQRERCVGGKGEDWGKREGVLVGVWNRGRR